MRHLSLLLSVLLLAACGAESPADAPAAGTSQDGPSTPAEPEATPKPARAKPPEARPTVASTWRGDGTTLEFNAWKMGCAGCESTIRTRLGAIEGVKGVEADLASTAVHVELEDGAERGAVIEAITKALETPESGRKFEIIRAEP